MLTLDKLFGLPDPMDGEIPPKISDGIAALLEEYKIKPHQKDALSYKLKELYPYLLLSDDELQQRYKHEKDVYAHLMINWLVNAVAEDINYTAENIWGFGTGITLLSPVGPLKFIWSWGPKNIYNNKDQQSLYHFSAGYNF